VGFLTGLLSQQITSPFPRMLSLAAFFTLMQPLFARQTQLVLSLGCPAPLTKPRLGLPQALVAQIMLDVQLDDSKRVTLV
jgi:hypothetical protein